MMKTAGVLTTAIPTVPQYIKTIPKGGLLNPKLLQWPKNKNTKKVKLCP